jgi:membrane protease YdiL (CAAX protease family)
MMHNPGELHRESMRRFLDFLRSVLPADLTQLIFLCGIVCLIVGAHQSWWSFENVPNLPDQLTEQSRWDLHLFITLGIYPILFAVAAGYFFCFWPVRRTVLRIGLCVGLPVLLSVGLICGRYLYFQQSRRASVLDQNLRLPQNFHVVFAALRGLGPGLHFTFIGLPLIAIYVSRLAFGLSLLPLTLPATTFSSSHDDDSWRSARRLTWFLVAWFYTVIGFTYGIVLDGLDAIAIRLTHHAPGPWVYYFAESVATLALVLVAILLIGTSGSQEVQRAVSWCRPLYLVLGALFALGVSASISVGQYVFDRVDWAAHSFGMTDPPQFWDYFHVPRVILLWLFFAALAEEIIFRGLLQSRFVGRYGLDRGLFLVGIVWAAFHFFSDFTQVLGVQQIVLRMGFRIADCVALTYVLGWLTLRSRSVLPAAIAHTVSNIFAYSPLGPPFPWKYLVTMALWAVLAYVLFRYSPVQTNDPAEPDADVPFLNHARLEPE